MSPDRLSVELTNRYAKGCWFCYNHSLPTGETRWEPEEVVDVLGGWSVDSPRRLRGR